MIVSGGDGHPVVVRLVVSIQVGGHLRGCWMFRGRVPLPVDRAEPELSPDVVSPCPQCPVRLEGQGVSPGGNGHPLVVLSDLCRRGHDGRARP